MKTRAIAGLMVMLFLASTFGIAGTYTVIAADGTDGHPGQKISSDSVSVTPDSQTVAKGTPATYTVTVTRASGPGSEGAFLADLSLIQINGPATIPSSAISFDPNPLSFRWGKPGERDYTKTSILTIATTDLSAGIYTFEVKAMRVDGPPFDYAVSDRITLIVEQPTPQVTRTQGFWATHPTYAWDVWEHITGNTVGTKVVNDAERLSGAFWSSISMTSTGTSRSQLDKARMQLLQQLVAAMLNVQAFGDDGTGAGLVDAGKAAFSGTDRAAILTAASDLEAFNKSGDTEPLPPGVDPGPADPAGATDKAFWDTLP